MSAGVMNNDLANETTFNNAFMARNDDTSTIGQVTISNTTSSTDKDTGALIIEGGLGVEENINAGGTIKNASTATSTNKDTGAIVTEGGVGIEENLNVGGDGGFIGTLSALNLSGTNTGDITLASLGSTPNANAASLVGQQLQLQPASASFGGAVTTIAQTFAGDKTFNDDVIIQGDLTVNGTTTTVNSATLEVTDPNITINNGGNDATAEGAGLLVERTGTSGSLKYENALSSKFKIGDLASESEIITASFTQTLTGNKTFSGEAKFTGKMLGDQTVDSSTTGSNASLTPIKFNHKVTNASLTSIRDFLSPSSSQFFVLTNDTGAAITIVNDNAASTRIQTGTGADLNLANGASLFVAYDTDDSLWRVVGGSGSGGGTFTLNAIGSSPNANGATYSAPNFNLEPASASFGGVVTTGAQTFAGAKTFSTAIAIGSGGTGQTTATAAFNVLSPLTTKGDLVTRDGTNNIRQAVGSDYNMLSGLSSATSGIGYLYQHTAYDLKNIGLNATVGSSALTINVLTANLATASTTDPILVSFRSSSVGSSSVNLRAITGSLSMVVSSGSTLGQTSGQPSYIWVYLIDNSGTLELAVSHSKYTEDALVSTTAEGGAGAADSATAIYSTTARSNVPLRLVGYLLNTQTTAGTWASTPTKYQIAPFDSNVVNTIQSFGATSTTTYNTPAGCTKLHIRMVGAGGGGGGSGTADGTTGGNGGSTVFGTRTAGGGSGTVRLSAGSGGSNSGSGYTLIANADGATGQGGNINPTTANGTQLNGGSGGNSFYGGGGSGGSGGGGGGAGRAYGAGGGGGGNDNTNAERSGGGGGAGSYLEFIINNPDSSYSYSVGTGGTAGGAGTSGRTGGAGADGILVIEEYYY